MPTHRTAILAFAFILLLAAANPAESARSVDPSPNAQSEPKPSPPRASASPTSGTTLAELFEHVRKIDPEARIEGHTAQFRVGGRTLILVADEAAGRMRIMTPIAAVLEVGEAVLHRMLQANFDAVLDARYAIADGIVWSAYIHPLPPLQPAQVASAIEQVWTAAETFGTTYTSGELLYGGGDSE